MKRAALHNLGCKVNAYETEAMQELLERAGYEICPFHERADVYVINTCTVTNMADRKSRQMIHRARKQNPDAVIVAAGCYVQTADPKELDPDIDIVIGNNRKNELVPLLEAYGGRMAGGFGGSSGGAAPQNAFTETEGKAKPQAYVADLRQERRYEDLGISKTAEHTRAYLKVQDGCNQFCTYCIIPYARGRVRSRALSDVVAEVEHLAAHGYQEVVLTGIHLSSYGVDFRDGTGLLTLIEAVHAVDGIRRIRFGSLEPGIVTEAFAKRLSSLPKVCPHFHLSLQSGCGATLKRMNRRYTPREYEERCDILRRYFDDPALTTDVIVGFPGETEEEFAASMDFVDRIGFYETHIFKYSRRKGTVAAALPGQIPEPVKTKRSARMIELGLRHKREFELRRLGMKREVLFEERELRGGVICQVGHTKEYIRIALPTKEDLKNRLCTVTVTEQMLDKSLH